MPPETKNNKPSPIMIQFYIGRLVADHEVNKKLYGWSEGYVNNEGRSTIDVSVERLVRVYGDEVNTLAKGVIIDGFLDIVKGAGSKRNGAIGRLKTK